MVERIKHILQSRQLTPTQFADAIGVARPIISHILSGRNKPSLEVVQKIIAAFPDLSLPWLLSGTEPILAISAAAVGISAARVAAPAETVAESPQPPLKAIKPVAAPTPAPAEPVVAPIEEQAVSPEPAVVLGPAPGPPAPVPVTPPMPLPVPILAPVAAPAAATTAPLAAFLEPGKKIKRIVIFYQDGTFGDYQPEQ